MGMLCITKSMNNNLCRSVVAGIGVILNVGCCKFLLYQDADKSLAQPTSRCILFDGENILFDGSLVLYI
jgi:hypothetical protein